MKTVEAGAFEAASEAPASVIAASYPLVLDLDQTLLRTDLLIENAVDYLKRNPLRIMFFLVWCLRGVAHLKHRLAALSEIHVELLPVNEPLLRYAQNAAQKGRLVVVASAANQQVAERVCGRFPFISELLASSEQVNLKGRSKAQVLKARFPDGFSYAGDSRADLQVWREARFGLFAGRNVRVRRRLQSVTTLEADLSSAAPTVRDWAKGLRLHQWIKNGLTFLPLILAGHYSDVGGWFACAIAFIALGLTASATYLLNDILDLNADRQHLSKRHRPCASGRISIVEGLAVAAAALTAGLTIAATFSGSPLVTALLAYCTATLAYSLVLKRIPILDVTLLAGLFTMRLHIGAVAANIALSSWLAVFSMFLFLSLALAKRATEIGRGAEAKVTIAPGRGYTAADAPLVGALGVSAALGAVLLLVLYLMEEAFPNLLYATPQFLWGAPALLGLGLGRIWLLCGRGSLHDDPVAFAVTDRVSLLLCLATIMSFVAAVLVGR